MFPAAPGPTPIVRPGATQGRGSTAGDRPGRRAGRPPRPTWRGIALFNAGYYWEAHEAWEGLWHAHGRSGAVADILKALIKLAAAGVKVRERQPAGVKTHARRAADLFAAAGADRLLGLNVRELAGTARELADNPPTDPLPPGTPVTRVFPFELRPN